MVKTFAENGIRFSYPENWELQREEGESGWTVHVQSPNTTFLLVSYDEERPSTQEMLESTLTGLRDVYEDVEVYDRVESLGNQPAVGQDMHFTSLDLTNTCCARSFYAGDATVLVLWQAADIDLEDTEPVLQAICASLEVED